MTKQEKIFRELIKTLRSDSYVPDFKGINASTKEVIEVMRNDSRLDPILMDQLQKENKIN